ncbi:unnamed protein product, partial [Rotaria magnacalcarata]
SISTINVVLTIISLKKSTVDGGGRGAVFLYLIINV